ncbi:MAG: putative nucleic acid-binding protein [Verrucomicrobiales bacterium]
MIPTFFPSLENLTANVAVESWADAQASEDLFTSVVVFAEIRFGIDKILDATFRRDLEEWLQQDLRSWYANRLLPIDEDVLLRWREMLDVGAQG